jgi:hypothetical protein
MHTIKDILSGEPLSIMFSPSYLSIALMHILMHQVDSCLPFCLWHWCLISSRSDSALTLSCSSVQPFSSPLVQPWAGCETIIIIILRFSCPMGWGTQLAYHLSDTLKCAWLFPPSLSRQGVFRCFQSSRSDPIRSSLASEDLDLILLIGDQLVSCTSSSGVSAELWCLEPLFWALCRSWSLSRSLVQLIQC